MFKPKFIKLGIIKASSVLFLYPREWKNASSSPTPSLNFPGVVCMINVFWSRNFSLVIFYDKTYAMTSLIYTNASD